MPKANEKLAESLAALQELQKGGRRVFRSRELSRTHRERLLRNGFLREVMKGWLMSSSPSAREGDSTPWYASFWEFCASYCQDRFDDAWHLSPEQSVLLHAQNTVIPTQVVVYSPKGHESHHEPALRHVPLRPQTARDAARGGRVGQGRAEAVLSRGSAREGSGGFLHPKSHRDSGRAGGHSRRRRMCCGFCSTAATRQKRGSSPERSAASAARRSPTRSSGR